MDLNWKKIYLTFYSLVYIYMITGYSLKNYHLHPK